MKKHLLKGIVALICLACLAAPALAESWDEHVYMAPNAKGDLLIYPAYFAAEGVETNFAVINTDPVESVVAKVVVRSHRYSVEVLDFLIFLTPRDEFKATLKYEGGKYVLTSSDDSLCTSTDGFKTFTCASVDSPKTFELYTPDCDDPSYGYIDVVQSWSSSRVFDTSGTEPVLVTRPIAKKWLIKAYFDTPEGEFDTDDNMTGFAEVVFPGADYAVYQPTVLANLDYDKAQVPKLESNPFDGNGNNRCEVEAVLAKNNLVIPYYDDGSQFTVPLLTFPTKLDGCPTVVDEVITYGSTSPFFVQYSKRRPTYSLSLFDMMEHKTVQDECEVSPCPPDKVLAFPEELNVFVISSLFDEGWAELTFLEDDDEPSTTCQDLSLAALTYEGAPVIGLIAEITSNGLSLLAPAYDFGEVSYDATGIDVNTYGCNGERYHVTDCMD